MNKGNVTLGTVLVIVVVAGAVTSGYFAYRNQKLSTELTVLKNTDPIKELAVLRVKSKLYVDVLKAFDDWQRPTNLHLLDHDTSGIDKAISALGDSEVSDLWQEVKANFPRGKQTGDFRDNEVPVLVISKPGKLLK